MKTKKVRRSFADNFNTMVTSLERTDPDFAEVLQKWRRFLFSSVMKVSKMVHDPEEDVLQDFLLMLYKSNLYYLKDLYRYNGHIYEIDFYDGSVVRLTSNPFNIKFKHTVWVNIEKIELVKKSSLSSFIYNQIAQYKVDRINACCRKKNGYDVIGYTEKTVVAHKDNFKEIKKKQVRKLRKAKVVSMSDLINKTEGCITIGDIIPSSDPSPDDVYTEKAMIVGVPDLPEVTQNTLRCLLLDPSIKDGTLAIELGYSRRKTHVAKGEIMRRFLDTPIGIKRTRCYFDGVEFQELSRDGDKVLLSLPSGKTELVDESDIVFRPNNVKPVYLEVSEVK